jgi:hypothetical protein
MLFFRYRLSLFRYKVCGCSSSGLDWLPLKPKHSVEQAITEGDWSAVDRYGRFLDPILSRISAEGPMKAKEVEQFRTNVSGVLAAKGCR